MVCRERERERELRGGFQLVGRLCAPRSRENSAGKIIFLPHSSPQFRAVVYSSPAEDDSARTFFSHRFHGFLSCSFFPARRPFFLPLPVSSIRYPLARFILTAPLFLGLIIKFPFWRTSFAVPLFGDTPIDCFYSHTLAFRSIIRVHAASSHPSHLHSHLRTRSFSCPRLLLFAFSSSFYVSFFAPFVLIFTPPSTSTTLDLWKWAIWGSSTVICLRRLIMAALLLSWISTSY